jgi:myo-inositol 2-dehydrogenase / D-chiro-inositol 1-dehydrogenase
MTNIPDAGSGPTSRRDFIRASSILMAGGAVSGGLGLARAVHAQGTDVIRIGLVGCGSRGSAAAGEALNAAGGPVELVALADVFPDKLQQAYRRIKGEHPDKTRVDPERRFVGLHAYRDLLATDVDLVILATPPGFRPLHFAAAVEAGKHVFLERPVAVDVPGVRRVLSAGAAARDKRLAVAVGLQRRHDAAYQETVQQLHNGIIGDLITLRVYWNGTGVRPRARRRGQTELEYQLRNWYFFHWLSGDHIVEQHVDNLDVGNWLVQDHPQSTNAQGGREVRKRCGEHGLDFGQIYDHFFCEYRYGGGTRMFSQCRHMRNCWNNVSEHVDAAAGYADISGGKIYDRAGTMIWQAGSRRAGHQQEFDDLLTALRAGRIPQEAEYGAASTMTAILGRMAAYGGRPVAWDEAMASELTLANTDALTSLEQPAPVEPDDEGNYSVPVPGVTSVV